MGATIGIRLGVMMFLEFFVWGAWLTSMGRFLSANGMSSSIGPAFSLHWAAAIFSPLFVGMIADRFFPTQRVLGAMHLIGAPLIALAPNLVKTGGSATPFISVIFVYMLCYMPTIGLTNTVGFRSMNDPEKQFPMIRVMGTIGWIAAGLLVSALGVDDKPTTFYIAAASGVLLGLYSFTLPHTPPPMAGKKISVREVLGLDALAMVKDRSFLVFIVSSFLICAPLSAYYAYTGDFLADLKITGTTGTQTIGQMSEVFFMLAMPWFFARLGVKWMLLAGMLAWVARYGLFALGAPADIAWMVYLGIALHGICYDFFFVTGYIYTEKKAPVAIRNQAQSFVVLMTLGFGMVLGSDAMGRIHDVVFASKTGDVLRQWQTFWAIPAVAAAVILGLFALLFREDTRAAVTTPEVAGAFAAEEQP